MVKPKGSSRSRDLVGGILSFALSAILGASFLFVVDRAHELFSSSALSDGVHTAAVLKAQISSSLKYVITNLKSEI